MTTHHPFLDTKALIMDIAIAAERRLAGEAVGNQKALNIVQDMQPVADFVFALSGRLTKELKSGRHHD